jgi:hypothetical protein
MVTILKLYECIIFSDFKWMEMQLLRTGECPLAAWTNGNFRGSSWASGSVGGDWWVFLSLGKDSGWIHIIEYGLTIYYILI